MTTTPLRPRPLRLALTIPCWIFLGVLAAAPLGAQDWPRWRGPDFNDTSPATGVFGERVELRPAWKRTIGTGYSGISIRGSHVVTMTSAEGSDFVIDLDATSGAERWRFRVDPAFEGLDGATDGPVSTPTIGPDAVFALGPLGRLVVLELETGRERWSTRLVEDHGSKRPHWGFTTAPLLHGENVIVQTGAGTGGAVTAFDQATGEVRWRAGTDVVDYQSPLMTTLGGVEQLLCAGERFLFGLDPRTGAELWRAAHRGTGFYERVINPVIVEEDLILIRPSRTHGRLMLFVQEEDGVVLEDLWETRHLTANYQMPVAHDGHVYGYSGPILTCIDTAFGERIWRSRPPGEGWTILVDGHLVVLTKAGSLHVIPATPEGYEEKASVQALDRLTWTPPAFANGRIYARDSYGEIACVEVVSGDTAALARAANTDRPGTVVEELERALAKAADPAAAVTAFLEQQDAFPVIEGDRIAHFFYRGQAQELVLQGDLLRGGEQREMRRLAGTDLYAASVELEPTARVGYRFVRDIDDTITDPLNPREAPSPLGPVSELFMPGAPAPAEASEVTRAGTVEDFQIDMPFVDTGGLTWGGPRRIAVYLPPEYEETGDRYPVLVVHDGRYVLDGFGAARVLDEEIGRGIAPVIGVFVSTASAYEMARSHRDHYRAMIVEQVLPEIDRRYRTIAAPEARASYGFSEGGCSALSIPLHHPDVFGMAASQSIYTGSTQNEDELLGLIGQAERLPRTFIAWGAYDTRDAVRQIDVVETSRRLFGALQTAGADVTGGERLDGELVTCWRERLRACLREFFPLEEE